RSQSAAGAPSLASTVLQFSGGAGRATGAGSEADFNTSFSVGNQIFGNTNVLLSGNVGYDRRTPATAFRGTFSRTFANGSTPEVSVTVRQIFLPGAFWAGAGRDDNMQSLSLSFSNRVQAGQFARFEYGFLYDS